ncbi:MAG: tetratricopeptide repeat protein [Myxococcota bacterium]
MNALALVLTSLSLAQPAGEARELAEKALRLEFQRDSIAVPEAQLSQHFQEACSRGFRDACRRETWIREGRPAPDQVLRTFEPTCDSGDPVACLAVSWALDQLGFAARTDERRDRLYRRAVRMLGSLCETQRFAPACHDYANLIFYGKGIQLDNSAKAAVLYWDKACDGKEYAACAKLARLMQSGTAGIKPKRKSAYEYAKRGCDAEYWDACYLLAQLNENRWDIQKRDTVFGGLCEEGHTESCYSLARSYYDGQFPEPEEGRAQELFEKACSFEHARSCFEAGRGMSTIDPTKTRSFFQQACDLDDAAGCTAQVELVLERGDASDVSDSLHAFEVACEQRPGSQACAWLAYYLLNPDSPNRDATRGRTLLSEVCTDETSLAKACFELGKCFEDKIGGPRDRTDATQYYRWACQSGTTEACFRAGMLLQAGVGIPQDDAEALIMYGRSCDGGISEGCTKAGEVLTFTVQIRRDSALAAKWYGQGCDQDNDESCLGQGETLERGIEGKPDMAGARAAYEKAITLGSSDAKTRLAYLLWNGFGGKKKKGRAKDLCRQACQEGNNDGCGRPESLSGA